MAITFNTSTRIHIDAPDAASALGLEKRLSHLHPVSVGRGSAWCVELEDTDDRLDEIVATVEHWLRAGGLGSTQLRVDGVARTITAGGGDRGGLGEGYDASPVLEHEP
jgi:hypothetical protein